MSTYILINRDTRIELAETTSKFKRFKKQICKFGQFVSPHGGDEKMVLDKTFAEQMKRNFDSGKYGVVSVPLGHPKTAAELAALNKGEMVEMSITDDGIDAVLEVRDEETVKAIESRNIPDVSMGFEMNYQDKKTGEFVGALLKHVGLVVDPYIKGMKQFMPLADEVPAILFSDSQVNEERKDDETMFVKVKNDRDFEVEVKYTVDGEEKTATVAAGAEIEVPADQEEAVKAQVADAVAPEAEAETKNEDKSGDDLSDEEKKAKELSDREAALAAREAEIAKKEAEAKFEELLSDGKVVPAQKDAFMALSAAAGQEIHLSDNETKTVDNLLSEFIEAAPKVTLTGEKGTDGGDGGGETDDVELSDEDRKYIERYRLSEEDYKEVMREKAQKKETK